MILDDPYFTMHKVLWYRVATITLTFIVSCYTWCPKSRYLNLKILITHQTLMGTWIPQRNLVSSHR